MYPGPLLLHTSVYVSVKGSVLRIRMFSYIIASTVANFGKLIHSFNLNVLYIPILLNVSVMSYMYRWVSGPFILFTGQLVYSGVSVHCLNYYIAL